MAPLTGIIEQEIIFARFCNKGKIETKFIGLSSPQHPDAPGITQAILSSLEKLDIEFNTEFLSKRLVGFGCDGAAVIVGKVNGVAARLSKIQPSLLTIHCFAHRLELTFKDAVRKLDVYNSAITLLMGIYYFYHNSPKQRQNLRRSFQALDQKSVIPTRVGGTRWVGHIVLAVETFMKSYQAIATHLSDVTVQKGKDAKDKARGYLRLMRRADIIAFLHLLLDVLVPLKNLSATLQSRDTTLADVPIKIEATLLIIKNYADRDGPLLSQFFEKADTYKNETLTGALTKEKFKNKRSSLANNLLDCLKKRFSDIEKDLIAATSIVSFKSWPKYSDENAEYIHVYGTNHVTTLVKHFANILLVEDLTVATFITEWEMIKRNLYARHKNNISKLKWSEVFISYEAQFPKILQLVDLILTLPASSAENERGFSLMKRVKSQARSRLTAESTSDLMSISLLSCAVDEYNPKEAVQFWLDTSMRSRRPDYKDSDVQAYKKLKLSENLSEIEQKLEGNLESDDEVEDEVGDEVDDDDDEGFEEDFDNELSEQEIEEKLNDLFRF